ASSASDKRCARSARACAKPWRVPMTSHPDSASFEEFVLGVLRPERAEVFTEHVAGCDACSARLAREGRVAGLLEGVGREPAGRPVLVGAVTKRRRAFVAAGAVLAVAAALALVFRGKQDPSPAAPSAPIANVVCPDGPNQVACVEDAHRHGLYVEYPSWAG